MADWVIFLSGAALGAYIAFVCAVMVAVTQTHHNLGDHFRRAGIEGGDHPFAVSFEGVAKLCTCGAASGACEKLPPPPQPGFAARRKGEAR